MAKRHEKVARSAGSRNSRDVLKSVGRAPSFEAKHRDIEAIRNGAALTVACAVRGDAHPFPKRFRHGLLTLQRPLAQWRSYWWALRRRTIVLSQPVRQISTRSRHLPSDWNIASAGVHGPKGLLRSSGFTVLVCTTDRGWFELAVPSTDVDLVATSIGDRDA